MLSDKIKGILVGTLIGATLAGGAAIAANGATLYDVLTNGVKIVVDGKELNPTDANGNFVEPFIYNGTTYLPVRAVANAIGKAVYWDGPEYTVYLGDMEGKLEYPTVYIKDLISVNSEPRKASSLTDNYGKTYSNALLPIGLEYITNMKYSKFKATLYVPEGKTTEYGEKTFLQITADDKIIYTSPVVNKTSKPIDVDVDIKGYNIIKITLAHNEGPVINFQPCLANAGFYQ